MNNARKIIIEVNDIKRMNDLTAQDFILYHIIKTFSSNKECTLSTKELSEISNIPYKNINRNLNRLVDLNYISIYKNINNLNLKIIKILK